MTDWCVRLVSNLSLGLLCTLLLVVIIACLSRAEAFFCGSLFVNLYTHLLQNENWIQIFASNGKNNHSTTIWPFQSVTSNQSYPASYLGFFTPTSPLEPIHQHLCYNTLQKCEDSNLWERQRVILWLWRAGEGWGVSLSVDVCVLAVGQIRHLVIIEVWGGTKGGLKHFTMPHPSSPIRTRWDDNNDYLNIMLI